MKTGTLVLFAGKMGAGKSTKASQISGERNAVLISEDEWLSSLYPNQITSLDDYLHFSSILKPLVKAHVINILGTGVDVLMDFPANTKGQRKWLKGIATDANAPNELVYLKASDEVCLRQIKKRRTENPMRALFDTEAMFHQVNRYFQEPEPEEGFNIHVVESSIE